MHELLVALCAIVSFMALMIITTLAFDWVDERLCQKQLAVLNGFIERGGHAVDHTLVALIMVELRNRMSMTGEYVETDDHRVLISMMARNIHVLTVARVRNQMRIISVVAEQINRQSLYSARINITTNNRVELVIQLANEPHLTYIKFNSPDSLF